MKVNNSSKWKIRQPVCRHRRTIYMRNTYTDSLFRFCPVWASRLMCLNEWSRIIRPTHIEQWLLPLSPSLFFKQTTCLRIALETNRGWNPNVQVVSTIMESFPFSWYSQSLAVTFLPNNVYHVICLPTGSREPYKQCMVERVFDSIKSRYSQLPTVKMHG